MENQPFGQQAIANTSQQASHGTQWGPAPFAMADYGVAGI